MTTEHTRRNFPMSKAARQRENNAAARLALVARRDRAAADCGRLQAEVDRFPTPTARQRLEHMAAVVDRLDRLLAPK